jgi:hypothetical protein
MTSETYQPDDDQLIDAHHQAAPENDLLEPDADLPSWTLICR